MSVIQCYNCGRYGTVRISPLWLEILWFIIECTHSSMLSRQCCSTIVRLRLLECKIEVPSLRYWFYTHVSCIYDILCESGAFGSLLEVFIFCCFSFLVSDGIGWTPPFVVPTVDSCPKLHGHIVCSTSIQRMGIASYETQQVSPFAQRSRGPKASGSQVPTFDKL